MEGGAHLSVLVAEVLSFLDCRPGCVYVDATVGSGGHARRILEQSAPTGKLIGLDCDAEAIARAKRNLAPFGDRFLPVRKNFRDLKEVLHSLSLPAVDGILADLGVSSEQLDDPERGISFRWEAPLDMRLDLQGPLTARELIRRLSAEEMEKIIRELGEERWAGRIAKAVVRQRRVRPLRTTGDLLSVIRGAVPSCRTRIHPATRTFQALRIAVNEELANLETFLRECPGLLKPGGRLAVISFHSLEDRIVKENFRKWGKRAKGETPPFRILTPKPVTPSAGEIRSNPRARSAKLRAIEKKYEPIERENMAEFVSKTLAIGHAGSVREAGSPARGVDRSLAVVTLVVAAVFIACALFSVWAHHQVISLGYEISQASQEEQELLQTNKKLRLEVASLKAPGRIQGTALRDLGFSNPQKDQLIIVR